MRIFASADQEQSHKEYTHEVAFQLGYAVATKRIKDLGVDINELVELCATIVDNFYAQDEYAYIYPFIENNLSDDWVRQMRSEALDNLYNPQYSNATKEEPMEPIEKNPVSAETAADNAKVVSKVVAMLYGLFDALSESDQDALMAECDVTHGELNFAHRLLATE